MSVTVDRQGALGLGRLLDRPLREADPEVVTALAQRFPLCPELDR